MKENSQIKKWHEYPGGQIAIFGSKEDLMEFIKEKIEKKANYKLQIFIRRERK